VGFVCGTWGRGIEEGRGGDSLYILGGWRRLTWSVEKKNGERSMYLCVILMEDG